MDGSSSDEWRPGGVSILHSASLLSLLLREWIYRRRSSCQSRLCHQEPVKGINWEIWGWLKDNLWFDVSMTTGIFSVISIEL